MEADLIPAAEQAMTLGGQVVTTAAVVRPGESAPKHWPDFADWLTTTSTAPQPHVDDDQPGLTTAEAALCSDCGNCAAAPGKCSCP